MGSRAINDDVEMTTLQLDVSHSIAPNKGARANSQCSENLAFIIHSFTPYVDEDVHASEIQAA